MPSGPTKGATEAVPFGPTKGAMGLNKAKSPITAFSEKAFQHSGNPTQRGELSTEVPPSS